MDFHTLDPEQRARFDEQGYLIIRGALTQEQCTALDHAAQRLIDSDQVYDRARMSATYDGFRNVIAYGGEPFERLLTHGALVSLAAQLLSRNLQLHTSQLIFKYPEQPGADACALSPGWHRDIHTIPSDLGDAGNNRFEVKIAYYLSAASGRASGVTLVARGSNTWTAAPCFDASGDPPQVVVPDLAPGDALLFENRTWHAAAVNTSTVVRRCVIYGYSYRWIRPDDWTEQSPQLLARLSPIGRDLLTPMHWKDKEGRFDLNANIPDLHAWFERHGAIGAAQAASERRLVEVGAG